MSTLYFVIGFDDRWHLHQSLGVMVSGFTIGEVDTHWAMDSSLSCQCRRRHLESGMLYLW